VTTPSPEEVTQLLVAWNNGDKVALNRLMPLVYQELHRLARRRLDAEQAGHTLQTTALVHEAYIRLLGQKEARWQNRAHFFAIATRMMRRILVDYARSRRYAKRGGEARKVPFDEMRITTGGKAARVLALDAALTTLAELDERKARLVELRFFGGLSIDDTAKVLGISAGTVKRDWTLAKAWLQRELSNEAKNES
jgi:RNA polymerase sigma factor (TIGR02999 family)